MSSGAEVVGAFVLVATRYPAFTLRAFGEQSRDRGNVNQDTPARDQRGDSSGFDFVPKPPRRYAKASGRPVQR
jgi:hypothetical protein